MSVSKYYRDELNYLRDLGHEFARQNPGLAPLLGEEGQDPDVERLLEGFAFLTGRIREKLEDEIPEFTQSVMALLWPHYLRPIPSMALLEFIPVPGALQQGERIPKGIEVDSIPIEGTACRFRTCTDVDLLPIAITEAVLTSTSHAPSCVRLSLRPTPGASLMQLKPERLRLQLLGDSAADLYFWLCNRTEGVVLRALARNKLLWERALPGVPMPVGFSADEGILQYPPNSFDGYRILQEYFAFPPRFLGVDVGGLDTIWRADGADTVELDFMFQSIPAGLRVSRETIKLHCVPAVNLFPVDAEPLLVADERMEYRLQAGGMSASGFEIYSVDDVRGMTRGSVEAQQYEPFYSFRGGSHDRRRVLFQTRLRSSVTVPDTWDTYISFVNTGNAPLVPTADIVSCMLTCSNGKLSARLMPGDIRVPTANTPQFVKVRSITAPTAMLRPPLDGPLQWNLIAHYTFNQLSLTDLKVLRGILQVYNFQADGDRQVIKEHQRRLQGLLNIEAKPETRLLGGMPVYGTHIVLEVQRTFFTSEGDLFLFTSIINKFLAAYASLNSFIRVSVKDQRGELYTWPVKMGTMTLV